jgi:hypothetical protein
MAITTADGWFAAARQKAQIRKSGALTTVAGILFSTWDVAGNPGAGSLAIGNTTTGVVPTDLTAGAPLLNAFGGGNVGYLAGGRFRSSVAGGLTVVDRLWHAGSVPMNSLATTSFAAQPAITQRLPGGDDYTNTEIWLEFNAAVSATATTIAVGYTNEAGTTGRTTGATASLSGYTTRRLEVLPLQAGDKGVRKIDSITVGGTVATTGSVNVLLVRRLADFDVRVANGLDAQAWDLIGAPAVFADSCLFEALQPDGTSGGVSTLGLDIING